MSAYVAWIRFQNGTLMNARVEGFYEILESCKTERLKAHTGVRDGILKTIKGFVWVGDIYEQNKVFCLCFPRSTGSLITKNTTCRNVFSMKKRCFSP